MEQVEIHVTDQDGVTHSLQGTSGWQLMEVIRDHGLPMKAECGGACACATCHVYVDAAWRDAVPPINDEEQEMLDEAFEVDDRSRLACQIMLERPLDGLCVTLAPGSEPDI